MAAALPHAFILEQVVPRAARFRVAGRTLISMIGGEARGLPLSMLFTSSSWPTIEEWTQRCFSEPALVELSVSTPKRLFRAPPTGRLLLLPMLDAENQVNRALGAILLDGPLRFQPIRLDLQAEPVRYEPIRAEAELFSMPNISERSFGEGQRPYLKLVVSNP